MFILITFQIQTHTMIKNVQVLNYRAKHLDQDNKKKTIFADFKITVP